MNAEDRAFLLRAKQLSECFSATLTTVAGQARSRGLGDIDAALARAALKHDENSALIGEHLEQAGAAKTAVPLPECDCSRTHPGPGFHRAGCPRAIALFQRAGTPLPERHQAAA